MVLNYEYTEKELEKFNHPVELILLNENNQVKTKKLRHFITTLKIKNAGPKRVAVIVNSGIETIADLLKATPEQLSGLEGFGMTLSYQILEDIHTAITDIPLAKILDASDIFSGIGEKRFEIILEVYPNLLDYSYDHPNKISEMLQQVKGIGKILADIVADNLATFTNWLYEHPMITIQKSANIVDGDRGNKLAGKTVVFSGFRSEDLKAKVKMEGGKVGSSISKNTNILVLKDLSPANFKGKARDAQALGTIIMSKEDFIKQYGF